MNIVDIATDYATKENAIAVKEIEIEVGELSGVVLDALEFCMEAATKESILEGANRNIYSVPGKARCRSCSNEFMSYSKPGKRMNAEPCPPQSFFNVFILFLIVNILYFIDYISTIL